MGIYFNKKINSKKYLDKWLLPAKSTCLNDGKKFSKNNFSKFCKATYKDAKTICSLNNAHLPNKYEIIKFVLSCGGLPTERPNESYGIKNANNQFYTECYEKKGYLPLTYWSQDISPNYLIDFEGDARFAWVIELGFGNIKEDHVLNKNYVWCITNKSGK